MFKQDRFELQNLYIDITHVVKSKNLLKQIS